MANQSIQEILATSMGKLRELVDANTVIGQAITTADGTTIIPVSKVAFGFGSGGSDFASKQPKDLFGGGSGGGVSVQPVAFLVIREGDVKLLQMNGDSFERLTNAIPEAVEKLSAIISKNKEKKEKDAN